MYFMKNGFAKPELQGSMVNKYDQHSDFSHLDKIIKDGEQSQIIKNDMEKERLERYFDRQRYNKLSKKSVKDLSWDDVHFLDYIKKSYTDEDLTEHDDPDTNLQENGKEYYIRAISNLIDEISENPRSANIRDDLLRIKELLNNFQNVKKNKKIQKSKDRIIKGWANVMDIVDSQGDKVSSAALKRAMPSYLKRGGNINFNHTSKTIGKILKYDFRKNPQSGTEGLWIEAELFDFDDSDNELWKNINEFQCFSIGGMAKTRECNNNFCSIPSMELYEISVVPQGANQLSTFTTV